LNQHSAIGIEVGQLLGMQKMPDGLALIRIKAEIDPDEYSL